MDFPVCPACGQSVIDDDAEDCPFCGSSMKAKPGAKPAAPKPAAGASGKPGAAPSKPGAPAASKPAPAGKVPAAKKPGAADDFPFDADLPASKAGVQATASPSKQRTLQVVCPMCETVGFVPPTSAGQDVKCANPKCMVPVFKAPVPVVEAPPPPPKKSNLVPILGVLAAVAVVAGLGIFVLPGMLASTPKPKGLSEEDKALLAEMSKGNAPATAGNTPATSGSNTATSGTPKETGPSDVAAPKSTDTVVADAIKQVNEACLVGDRRQRSKPFCRQMAAEANAHAGNAAAAREHLAQLIVVGADVPYYRILPNLELFWSEWAAGDKAAAGKSLDAALADAPKIPKLGRNQLEISGRLAAALAAAGRIPDGLAILQGHQSSEGDGQLAAQVQISSDGGFGALSHDHAVLPWTSPQSVAATVALVSRNQLTAARDWAMAQPNDDAKAECLAVWAQQRALMSPQLGWSSGETEVGDAVKNLAPALASRVWARTALGRVGANDPQNAETALKRANELLASVAVPTEPTMPDYKQSVKFTLPAAAPLLQAATAAAEIAYVQSLSAETKKDAVGSLDLALKMARGLAPGLPAAAQKLNEAEQLGSSGLSGQLKTELKLKSDDDARLAMNKYRRLLNDIAEASRRRLDLQSRLLSRFAELGLQEHVWIVVSSRSAEADLNQRDDFLATPVVADLLEVFQGTETEKAIRGSLEAGVTPKRPEAAVLRELLNKGDAQGAAELITGIDNKTGRRDELALVQATALANAEKIDVALQFVGRLDDIVLREEAYRLVAGLAAQRGKSEAVVKQIATANQATERAALCRGLVGGLKPIQH